MIAWAKRHAVALDVFTVALALAMAIVYGDNLALRVAYVVWVAIAGFVLGVVFAGRFDTPTAHTTAHTVDPESTP